MRCCSLATLLAETGLSQVDVLQIDTEGWDYEILKLVDFTKIKPAIINYEHAHLNPDDWDSAIDLLTRNGYHIGIGRRDTVAYLANETPDNARNLERLSVDANESLRKAF